MDAIHDEIRDAVEKELEHANEMFPMFASYHEAIAVIAEERDEAADAMQTVREIFDTAWRGVKRDNDTVILSSLNRLMHEAEHLAVEACQIAAMCEKAIQSAKEFEK